MARITEEQIQEINEIYHATHNKSLTARTVGVSVASVNKYIKEDYIPIAERMTYTFDKEVKGIDSQKLQFYSEKAILDLFNITEEERADMIELQKEIM